LKIGLADQESTNRFTSSNFTYDENGNITRDTDSVTNQARQTTFNGDNKQTEVKDANGNSIGKYYCDGEGKRVKKITATETTVFVYSGGKLVAEYATQISQNPTISYTTADHLGSPRVITDKTGNIKSRRDFMPFGEEIQPGVGNRTTAQKYTSDNIAEKFTGKKRDSESGFDYFEARYYASKWGRFTTSDEFVGGPEELTEFDGMLGQSNLLCGTR
jgi:RHS repeat-associated protein